jgi:hypothetical protein
VPRLTGPNASVVARVNRSINAYLAEEKGRTERGATLNLRAGAPHVGSHVLSVSFGGDRFTPGAAHPVKLTSGMVFDLRAGERTRIQNVFTSTDAGLRRLQSVVRPELQRRFGTVDPAVTEPTVANYGRFVVNPDEPRHDRGRPTVRDRPAERARALVAADRRGPPESPPRASLLMAVGTGPSRRAAATSAGAVPQRFRGCDHGGPGPGVARVVAFDH